ncbi:MAG TPA: hypothetical protein VGC21_11810 [Telluria sp.]|jgi:hypothetical protein
MHAASTVVNAFQIMGWEKIDVPAGSFDAIRIDGQRTGRPRSTDSAGGGGFLDTRMTYWFAPSVKAFVKFSFAGKDKNGKVVFDSGIDLAAYKPPANKTRAKPDVKSGAE